MPTGKTVLLVEDNPSVLLLMERALAPEGYSILTAGDAEEALRIVEGADASIDLLLADVVLPRAGGLELAGRLAERDPRLRVVLVSGYAGEEAAHLPLPPDRVAFLEKPFSAAVLRATVRRLLEEAPEP